MRGGIKEQQSNETLELRVWNIEVKKMVTMTLDEIW